MARAAIAINTLKGTTGDAQTALDSGMTSGDLTNDHEWTLQDGDIVLVQNTHAANTVTVALIAVANAIGRTVTSSKTLAAGKLYAFGPLSATGWATAGVVQVDLSGTGTCELCILRR